MLVSLLRNPRSGSGKAEDVVALLRAHGARVAEFEPEQLDDAVAALPERLVVAGGDGSIGPAAEAAARARIPMALVPVGTANDFAAAMGLPDALEDAAELAATGVRTRLVDLAHMDGRPFVNVASIGLAPRAASEARDLKRVLGTGAYALGALRAAVSSKPVRARAICDGEIGFAGQVWQLTVACSGAFGGGAEVEADPQDGRLDTVAIEAGSRVALAVRAFGLRRGTIGSQRGVHTCRSREVELDVAPRTPFNVDGEVVTSGPARFTVAPREIELVVG